MRKLLFGSLAVALLVLVFPAAALADPMTTITYDDGSGLSGTATFGLTNSGNTLTIVLTNTSTSTTITGANGILASIYFTLPDGVTITVASSSVAVTSGSSSTNFDISVSGGDDVSGEWGIGNWSTGSTWPYADSVTTNTSHATQLSGDNLDSEAGLDGPAGGLTNGADTGGLGAINNSVTITLALSSSLSDLSFLRSGTGIEFGSDYKFITYAPEPSTVLLLGVGVAGLAGARRWRKRRTG